jgi:hypothetical protein
MEGVKILKVQRRGTPRRNGVRAAQQEEQLAKRPRAETAPRLGQRGAVGAGTASPSNPAVSRCQTWR